MFIFKNKYLKLFLTTLLIVISIYSSKIIVTAKTSATEVTQYFSQQQLVAKKSGGRSRGGSFKSKPRSSGSRNMSSDSRNNRSSDSRSNYRNNSSPSRNYNNDYEPAPTYRRSTTRSYFNRRQPMHPVVRFLIMTIVFLIFGGIIFIPLFILFKSLRKFYNKDSRAARRTRREINNNRVTVSQIQVAFSAQVAIQQDLSELSLSSNTDTSEGLLELMRNASLIILRNSDAWTHVLSSSVSMNIEEAESAFEALSIAERSKYSSETLSNVDGKIRTRQQVAEYSDDANYLVVTLLFGTVDDKPLFNKINTEPQLTATLQQLAAMKEDYLLKFELLWSPQTEEVYLTDEELLMEYTKMIPLI